jgi:putative Mn2+ efflux pump MntP
MLSLVLIALSLSMDAFAVSLSAGISIRNLKIFHAARGAFFFGLFQFLMPVVGWFLGQTFSSYIEAFDHWAAFGLLAFIGGRMLHEAFGRKGGGEAGREPEAAAETAGDIRRLGTLLTLALATSIDALAVGISFNILNREIWGSAALIGGITFLVCFAGFEAGIRLRLRLGHLFEKAAQITGGLILIGIGAKILLEHLLGA